ncbi:MAG TPA: ribulose-phosphate 3-epimerase [Thermodesulfovibrionales bacterium]|jgi:ribulose-phosphate 3-epimerase|nr:ribulose-phosphate 3-epimerase [Thermodesulfovibrionales bacterium]
MIKLAPSILSADFMRLGDEIKAAESAGADMLHLDIMDGHFVPNITIGPFIVEAIRKVTNLPLDVHLMIEEPDRYLKDFINAGAHYLTVHAEASVHLHRTVHWIRESGAQAGVSINPATPVWSLDSILSEVDLVLIMSVNPGFGGQNFIPQAIEKVRMVKGMLSERGLSAVIEVDGGIKYENAREVVEAGAGILVMGSAFFHAKNYRELVVRLRDRLHGK